MLNNFALVFVGGGLGSVSRFGISMLCAQFLKTSFPAATLISNTLSCLLLGLVFAWGDGRADAGSSLRLLLITGFCGGFSTFSAFSYETVELMRSGQTMYAVLNVAVSLAICFGIVYLLIRNNA